MARLAVGVEICIALLLATAAAADPPPTPNFIVIYLDDTRVDGVDAMPVVAARLAANGVVFENAFTPNAVCCPSRASLLTGLYSLHHGTHQITGPAGGAAVFRESGADQDTLAVRLQAAGYRTGLFGKYLNGYSDATEGGLGPGGSFYVPPGWDRWWAMVSPSHYGGVHGVDYEVVQEDGSVTTYDEHGDDSQYSTDLSAVEMRAFVASAVAEGKPFFAYWTPYASHVDDPSFVPVPADRHFGSFFGLPVWRPPSWNEPDVSDKPRWVQADRFAGYVALTDTMREMAYESLLAVDEQIDLLLDDLVALGVYDDTVVVFMSDNGVGWGEHRWFVQAKECPYEECQRVPMIATYPRQTEGSGSTSDAPILNIDIAPTLLHLAGLPVPKKVDGRSFAGWLSGSPPGSWRTDYLIEHWRRYPGDNLEYTGQPLDGDQLRLFYGDPRSDPRPSILYEFDDDLDVSPGAVAIAIGPTADDSFTNLALAVVPVVPVFYLIDSGLMNIFYLGADLDGVYWWEEVDQGGNFEPVYPMPNHFGVRDVAGGYTWIEYETGERELYDLNVDPYQLENVADDAAYQAIRAQLEARLTELLNPPNSGVPSLTPVGAGLLAAVLGLVAVAVPRLRARHTPRR